MSGREHIRASDFDFPAASWFRAWTANVYDHEYQDADAIESTDLLLIECGERTFEPHRFPEIQHPETLEELMQQYQSLRSKVQAFTGTRALATARKQAADGTLRRPRPEPLGATNLSVQLVT